MLQTTNPLTLLALLAFTAAPTLAAPSPPSSTTSFLPIHTDPPLPSIEGVTLSSLRHSGPGCPPGSVKAGLVPPHNWDVTLLYDTSNFTVSTDALTTSTCTSTFRLDYPAGWRFAVTTSAYEVAVDSGFDVRVKASATYGVEGVDASANNEGVISGSASGVHIVPDWKFVSMLVLSPCGATSGEVTVDAKLEIEGTAVGEATLQGQELGISWVPCP
ncbi:hypothetical protein QBC34DRAFT_441320 [Podospora aff. communis PSN243]|uniref:Secreted protein n=1 Tax=Podospora aff. communis PSN243 TaxID=3040156 RepID=A0AAV9GCT3_9PEZI|nr:hypothetical protein QBC34DRAFT_441320 [Podospora aff. communis PSN243]